MVHHLSSIWLTLGLAVFPAAINAICTSGMLCELNTLAGLHQRFWGTCVQHNVTTSTIPQYVALAVEYVQTLISVRMLDKSTDNRLLSFKEFGMVTPTTGFELVILIHFPAFC